MWWPVDYFVCSWPPHGIRIRISSIRGGIRVREGQYKETNWSFVDGWANSVRRTTRIQNTFSEDDSDSEERRSRRRISLSIGWSSLLIVWIMLMDFFSDGFWTDFVCSSHIPCTSSSSFRLVMNLAVEWRRPLEILTPLQSAIKVAPWPQQNKQTTRASIVFSHNNALDRSQQ